jgi:16S rRNA (uracil1498-N3)-methyltransferase
MAWRRFYIDKECLHGDELRIGGELFHHIREVCRFTAGDRFEVLPGDGRALLVEITSQSRGELSARVLGERPLPEPGKPLITLALSVPKLPKVDWIVEKSVELGVHEIRPFVSDYSFLRKREEISGNRVARWRKLVNGATQQSGRGDIMAIREAVTLEELLEEFNRTASVEGLFPYEGESRMGLAAALARFKSPPPERLWVFVGSEGGFSKREVELFAERGLEPVSMGAQILRVETACLALVSIIKYETGALA